MNERKQRALDLELCGAFSHENPERVRQLIEMGANVNSTSKWTGWSTPLWMTVNLAGQEISKTWEEFATAMAEFLPNSLRRDHSVERAKSIRILKLILSAKPDVNMLSNGSTPLRGAVHWRDLEVVELLLANGANPNAETFSILSKLAKKQGRRTLPGYCNTVLHEAVEKNSLPIVKALVLAGADAKRLDQDRKTPLDIARKKKFMPIVEFLEKAPPK